MTDAGLPAAVRQLIERHLTSIEQTEILLLLAKNPAVKFTVQNVYDVILSTKLSVAAWLEYFVQEQIVQRSDDSPTSYQFAPDRMEVRSAVVELVESYQARPVRVIEAIYQRSSSQSDPARMFAEAFRLRKP